jgi:hypothetical protein
MQLRNHVVVVATLLVLGTSAILGATVQTTASCSIPAMSQPESFTTASLCSSDPDVGWCPAPKIPVSPGEHVITWAVTGDCFGPKS